MGKHVPHQGGVPRGVLVFPLAYAGVVQPLESCTCEAKGLLREMIAVALLKVEN